MRYPLALLLLAFLSPSAHAYVDPGSGGLLLQLLLGAAVGALIYIKRILAFFRRKPPKEKSPAIEETPQKRRAGGQ